jgi:hypothetical protein
MRHPYYIFLTFALLEVSLLTAQETNPFSGYLPIRESPELNWSSAMVESEPLIFEAEPILHFHIYNSYNYYDSLFKAEKAEAFYLYFNSHFRMFQGKSKPVRMPSYKMFIGWQRSFELSNKSSFSFAIETGHYSNGQSGCAWNDSLQDGSRPCRLISAGMSDQEDLSARLNRVNGNFSTNLSKVNLQYVTPRFRKNRKNVHRLGFEYTFNHEAFALMLDYGGSADSDIGIIGKHRFNAGYELIRYTDNNFRYSISQSLSRLYNAHPSIEPWRYEATVSIFPEEWITAFFFSYIYGHDDYNYRIVDSGNQFSIGVRWDLFQLGEFR